MPPTIRKGSTGRPVLDCQGILDLKKYPCVPDGIFGDATYEAVKAFQWDNNLAADGIVGPDTWAVLLRPPEEDTYSDEEPWSAFNPLLGPAMAATYAMPGQVPTLPQGVHLSSSYVGGERTNCSMFSAYFVGCGFNATFSGDQWSRWQVPADGDPKGYGPGVTVEWGVGEMMPPGSVPKNGVYLLQTFTAFPKGHSWMVLDYDEASGKILTLESNTYGSGLNGVGFGSLGPIRSNNAHDWRRRVSMTWEGRIASASEVHMARLAIDHDSVLAWIADQ